MISTFLDKFPGEFINLSDRDRTISLEIYRLLMHGRPVPIDQISASLNFPVGEISNVVKSWPGVFCDNNSSIVGFWGLTIHETRHSLLLNNRRLYTWCSWDSLFIPQIIRRTCHVESTDPFTKETVWLKVTPTSGVESMSPSGTVVSFLMPDAEKFHANVIKSFCHYVHFFCSIESANKWISNCDKKEELLILSVQEAYKLGTRKNKLQYGELLGSYDA